MATAHRLLAASYGRSVGDPVCYLHLLDEEGRMPEPSVPTGRHYEVTAIGRVESRLLDLADAPRQGDEGAPAAWLVFEPRSSTDSVVSR